MLFKLEDSLTNIKNLVEKYYDIKDGYVNEVEQLPLKERTP
jgi:hypothetical protein